jgi:hypothetical protein
MYPGITHDFSANRSWSLLLIYLYRWRPFWISCKQASGGQEQLACDGFWKFCVDIYHHEKIKKTVTKYTIVLNSFPTILNLLPIREFLTHGDITIAGEGLQNLGLCSALRAFEKGGGLSYHACCYMKPRFFRSRPNLMGPQFSCLVRHARRCWRTILTRNLTGASYDTQDAEDPFLPGSSQDRKHLTFK